MPLVDILLLFVVRILFVGGCSGLSGVDFVVEGCNWFWLLVIMVGGCLSHF